MTNSGNNQPEEIDRDRAKRLMEEVNSGRSSDTSNDQLLSLLYEYKRSASLRVTAEPGESTWEAISSSIDRSATQSNFKRLNVSVYWKAAAILLAASLLVLAYFALQPSEPVLLASSNAERSSVELIDGSVVTLRPFSDLYVLNESDDLQTYRIDGEAFFDVAEIPSRTFTAISGNARVTVTGTEFTLSNWSNAVRVYLESGSVTFSSLNGTQSVNLQPGEYSEQVDNQITQPVTAGDQAYTGWLTDELSLNSRTVADVIAEVEHHFNITIEIPNSLMEERLSGNLQLESEEQVLDDLGLTLNGEFVPADNNDDLYRFESRP